MSDNGVLFVKVQSSGSIHPHHKYRATTEQACIFASHINTSPFPSSMQLSHTSTPGPYLSLEKSCNRLRASPNPSNDGCPICIKSLLQSRSLALPLLSSTHLSQQTDPHFCLSLSLPLPLHPLIFHTVPKSRFLASAAETSPFAVIFEAMDTGRLGEGVWEKHEESVGE